MLMRNMCCEDRCSCTILAVIISAVVGIVLAFAQMSSGITLSTIYLAVILGIAVIYLAVTLLSVATARYQFRSLCSRSALDALIIGIIGTIIMAIVSILVGIAATVIGAVIVGLLGGFLALMLSATVCVIKFLSSGIAD